MKRRLTYHLIAGMLTLAAALAVVIGLRSWLWKQEDYRNLGGQNALLGAQITQFVLEKAVDNGLFERETLLHSHYDRVGQGDPARYRSEFDGFFDRNVTKILKAFQAHGDVYYAYVVNNDGFIAAHTDPAKSKTMLAEPGLGKAASRGEPGDRLVRNDCGYDFREFRAPIVVSGLPWGEFRVGIPIALTYHRARISGLGAFGITFFFSLAFVGAMTWLIRRSLRPLDELTRATRQMATGDTLVRCNYRGNDELGVLAQSFNVMAETIAQTQEGLERQVHKRTAELTSANSAMVIEIAERTKAEESARIARDAAEAANRAKSEFLANMSHEIRTPMTAILGFLDIVAEAVNGPDQQEAVETIKRNGHHLLSLINDILDLSKIESGKLQMETVPVSPVTILTEVVSLMRVRADARGLALKLKYVGPIPETIYVDPMRLRQILVNLVGNAIKFTETGEVRIVARLLDGDSASPKFQCEVIDTGIGIEPEHLGRLFQPFQQADNSTTRKFGGTGLGLAISQRLAGLLGGDIAVRSEPQKGSTFALTLATGSLEGVRFLDYVAEAVTKPGGGRTAADAPSTSLHCRILLAEDGPDNQRLISFILRKAGAEVVICDNGQKAFDKAFPTIPGRGRRHDDSNVPFDIILMDMQMPVMDGYEATRRLRQHGYTRPILALTAHAMKDDRQKCLDAGCDDYLTKPIVREQFLSTIASYLRPVEPAQEIAAAGGSAP